jgi:RimJ/RimL family protein N-acetyltransferase
VSIVPNGKLLFETERLSFRRYEPGDLDFLISMTSDPLMMRYVANGQARAPETQRETFPAWLHTHASPSPFGFRVAVRKRDGERIGHMGLLNAEIDGAPYAEVAYWVARPFWGKGYAGEAAQAIAANGFAELDCDALISIVRPANTASRRVAGRDRHVAIPGIGVSGDAGAHLPDEPHARSSVVTASTARQNRARPATGGAVSGFPVTC